MGKKIIWTRIAIDQLFHIHEYILNTQKSLPVADKVVSIIHRSATGLNDNFEMYPPDGYKANNDGSYRAYTVCRYRVSYKVSSYEIYITGVLHTSRMPQSH